MPITEVAAKLAAENLDLPGGNVERDGRSVTLRTKGEFRDADEMAGVILRSEGGSTVRVRDVGTVVDGFEERTTTTRLNGADAVSFSVRKQSGANTVEITDRVAGGAGPRRPVVPRPADPPGAQRRRLHQGERPRRPQAHPVRRRRWPCW